MRILLVSEGKHERGTEGRQGALEILVRRLLNEDADISNDRLANPRIHAHHGKGQGYYKRTLRWMLEAAKQGFDALVLLVDEDGKPERMSQINEAQSSTLSAIKRALGIAIRKFDAWILADEEALTTVLGESVSRQPQVERISNPKHTCADLLSRTDQTMTQTEMYARVAQQADLNRLAERAPNGFAPFADRVRDL